MPIYEYKCAKCGKTFEFLQSISSAPLTGCIYCQGQINRLVSAPAFQFKGSGWYATDYQKKGASENSPQSETKDNKNANARKVN